MKRDLYRIIRSLRDRERGINPDPAWLRSTRETLLMQVKNTMPSAETEAIRRRLPIFAPLYARVMRTLRGPAVATLSISTVVLGGSIASVSAAENSIPGDTLYSVKLVTEQARLALASTKQDKVKLKAEFTIRRVAELKTIVSTPVTKKEERASQAADILKRDLDTLKQQLADVQEGSSGSDVADIAKTVDKNAVEVVKALNETKNELSQEVKEKVVAAQVQAADNGIKALEALVDVHADAGNTSVSDSDIGSSLAAHAEVAAVTVAATKALIGSSTSTRELTEDAQTSLNAVQQLVQDNKLNEAVGMIKDATAKSFTAQQQAEEQSLALSNATSTSSTSNVLTASSTASAQPALSGAEGSTSGLPGSTTSTMNGTSPSTSTTMTTTTKP
ncbi:hypothetical protein A3E39_01390 [Candidatus Uhrbacteria bacterium RIFCSPHIGHO2_12_FULL_60_25]|uniref:DUF5667 domain-containing protein n=1 Tax=Candidatus Uhrbacteria bacterium RIFCSPHIGHO2_12_FULL_60_25 TaxID=1802399 RepID=A0A1F7UM51_9BACT|nr:MAG: hypothetical protein A3D73_03185 [Candidatus Uhrbacteria bacterium RIFCSPHIGHO2_02_FULL_60_44]OGL78798.1 MAG: hypothetical protein A3E39_01390 [Candidatus Uhrbacteria bacterium RIFCSPHIGHO2_12_FULL_60_25]